MYMDFFQIGDRVRLSDEMLSYSANKHWSGKKGTIIQFSGSYTLIKWDHLENPIWQHNRRHLQLADVNY